FAVVLISADVAVLTEIASHVAGGKEDRAGALRTAIEQLLAAVMKVRADPRTRGQLASAEFCAHHAVNSAVPWTEVAMGEHPVDKLAAQLQQAWPVRRRQQRRALSDRLPERKKDWREPLQLGP